MHNDQFQSSAEFDSLLQDDHELVRFSRRGIQFDYFLAIVAESPFSLAAWGDLLHLGKSTIAQYRLSNKTFDPARSERILEISRVLRQGEHVFGGREFFFEWLNSVVPALGNICPKSLLDNTFGIEILRDELTKIEHGVLA